VLCLDLSETASKKAEEYSSEAFEKKISDVYLKTIQNFAYERELVVNYR
jgi:hypothetical protein